MDPDNRQFTNFKIHTQYSICEGAARIDDLSDFCKENKLKALGICDSFNLCGALESSLIKLVKQAQTHNRLANKLYSW